jgi:SAM-dependent methyltransferase
MQGYRLLALAGKRVLRPGGIELTRRMLETLSIGQQDRVVEFAPGLGMAARRVFQGRPFAYWGVERDPDSVEYLRRHLSVTTAQIILGRAEESGLPNAVANVVVGEAVLSMQNQHQKNRIVAEASRLLTLGGRYAIHELCLGDNLPDRVRREMEAALSKELHVGAQPLCRHEWEELVECNGFAITWTAEVPMHLLSWRRVLQDEGVGGSLRIAFRLATQPELRSRVRAIRHLFIKYRQYLGAIVLIGQRR